MVNTVTIEEYQAFVETTWAEAKDPTEKELRLFLGMIGELGEIAEKTKNTVEIKRQKTFTSKIFNLKFN